MRWQGDLVKDYPAFSYTIASSYLSFVNLKIIIQVKGMKM